MVLQVILTVILLALFLAPLNLGNAIQLVKYASVLSANSRNIMYISLARLLPIIKEKWLQELCRACLSKGVCCPCYKGAV